MKKYFATLLVVILVSVVLNPSSSHADSQSSIPYPSYSSIADTGSWLSELTIEEYNEVMENAIPMESLIVNSEETQSNQRISAMAALNSWVLNKLGGGQAHLSSEFYIPYARTVTLTVVQWGDNSSFSQPSVSYSLVNKNYKGEYQVITGRFTDTNTSIQINVPAGNYQVMIVNHQDYTISGNGYLY
jgi:hypothetical protein